MKNKGVDNFYRLFEMLVPMERCHICDEMEKAYNMLVDHYSGSRIITSSPKSEINGWKIPPGWKCIKADLKDEYGNIIASKKDHILSVFTYSPSIKLTLSLDELDSHLFSDPSRPDLICFHFRNQYRHWDPQWGFCIPHKKRLSLSKSTKYHVDIETKFDYNKNLIQSDYNHQGKSSKTFLLVGHFDHPGQANDGLAGCIAAYEIIKRLKDKSTYYSYRSFASVEIVGSIYYLDASKKEGIEFEEALFLGFSAIDSPLIYQTSYKGNSYMDRIIKYLFEIKNSSKIYNHRELIGNDENVYDSVGYNIPTGTLMRWPFNQYHTNNDSLDNSREENIEYTINFVLEIINIIETDYYVCALFQGLPCLANPEIDLYLSLDNISGVSDTKNADTTKTGFQLSIKDISYIKQNDSNLYELMQNVIRMADGNSTVLDIAEKVKLPYGIVYKYILALKEKGLVELKRNKHSGDKK